MTSRKGPLLHADRPLLGSASRQAVGCVSGSRGGALAHRSGTAGPAGWSQASFRLSYSTLVKAAVRRRGVALCSPPASAKRSEYSKAISHLVR